MKRYLLVLTLVFISTLWANAAGAAPRCTPGQIAIGKQCVCPTGYTADGQGGCRRKGRLLGAAAGGGACVGASCGGPRRPTLDQQAVVIGQRTDPMTAGPNIGDLVIAPSAPTIAEAAAVKDAGAPAAAAAAQVKAPQQAPRAR